MKKMFSFSIILLAFWSCTTHKNLTSTNQTANKIMIDSSEYEIIIIDPDFDRWYQLYYSPAQDRSNDFYRSKTIFAVSRWNDYYLRSKFRKAIDSSINYNPTIEYGIDVNRKLYWYFKYIEENYRVPLL